MRCSTFIKRHWHQVWYWQVLSQLVDLGTELGTTKYSWYEIIYGSVTPNAEHEKWYQLNMRSTFSNLDELSIPNLSNLMFRVDRKISRYIYHPLDVDWPLSNFRMNVPSSRPQARRCKLILKYSLSAQHPTPSIYKRNMSTHWLQTVVSLKISTAKKWSAQLKPRIRGRTAFCSFDRFKIATFFSLSVGISYSVLQTNRKQMKKKKSDHLPWFA